MLRSRPFLLVCLAAVFAAHSAHAQSTITSSLTYDGSIPPYGFSQTPGLLVVDGSGSPVLTLTNSATTSGIQDTYVGSTSGNTGAIDVYGGSSLITNGIGIFGFNAGSTGSITIAGTGASGAASQWTGASQLYLGYNGTGYLTVTGGGRVANSNTTLGVFTNSIGVVAIGGASAGGTASQWNMGGGTLLLGSGANSMGLVTVTGGGQVNAGAVSIAVNGSATGALSISGAGSIFTVAPGIHNGLWVSGTSIGAGGTGSLTVNNGGSLVDGSVLEVWNHGTITLDTGGTISTSNFTRQTGGVFNFLDGTLTVSGGTYQQPNGALTINGTPTTGLPMLALAGGASTVGITNINLGTLSNSQGSISVLSGATLSSSGNVLFGSVSSSTGMAVISGSGSTWSHAGSIYLGGTTTAGRGTGSLTVNAGGSLSVSTALKLYQHGMLTLDTGGAITAKNFDATTGSFNFNGGTLTVSGGTYTQSAGALTINGTNTPTFILAGGATMSGVTTLTVGGTSAGFRDTTNFTIGGAGMPTALAVQSGGTATFDATLAISAASTLSLAAGGAISTKNFDESTGTFNFNGGTLTVNGGTITQSGSSYTVDAAVSGASATLVLKNGATLSGFSQLIVGDSNTGSLQILNGSSVTASGVFVVGKNAGSDGSITVSGSNSILRSLYAAIIVGGSGAGSLNVLAGGQVNDGYGLAIGYAIAGGPGGSVTVSGAGSALTTSTYLDIGQTTTGSLTVNNGGAVILTNNGVLQLNKGTLTLDSGGTITTSAFQSQSGSTFTFNGGTLTVSGGAYTQSSGILTVNGTNSPTFVLAGGATTSDITNAVIGNTASAALNVLGGSVFSNSGSASLALLGGSTGVASVSGSGSQWNVGSNLYVGGSSSGAGGVGLLSVSGGGGVNVSGAAEVYGGSKLSVGTGGTFTASSLLVPGELTNNGNVYANTMISGGGMLAGTGTITGNLTMASGSHYSPGNSPGIQNVYGDVTWNTMTYSMQVANISASPGIGYDSMALHAANAALGQLTIVGGSTIEVDLDTYPTGTSSLNFNNLSPFDMVLVSTEGGITGFNTGSFVINSSAFAAYNPLGGGLFSIIESADLKSLLVHFAPASVPEPATVALVGIAALGLRWRVQRRRA